MPDPRPFRRRPRALAVLAMAVALVAFPLGALASHQYSDVPDSNAFHGDITAITNAGITSGCGGGNYCPDRNVTRAEMAAFMNRLGALASNKTPVVNATKVDGYDANSLSRVAWTSTEDAGPDGSSGTVLSTVITAPARGYFSIVASVDSFVTTTNGDFTCQLQVDGTYVPGSNRWVKLVNDNNEEQDCTTNGVVSTCGGEATITLETFNVDALTFFQAGTLQVFFTPFNGTGGIPSIFSCLVLSPGPDLKAGVSPDACGSCLSAKFPQTR